MVMIRIITAVTIIAKYSLPTIDFATRYSTRYSDFLLQPYSNPTRSQKRLLVGPCLCMIEVVHVSFVIIICVIKMLGKSFLINCELVVLALHIGQIVIVAHRERVFLLILLLLRDLSLLVILLI